MLKMNKKARDNNVLMWIIFIYLGLGVYFHLTKNPNGNWISDLLTGGFNLIKGFVK